MYKLTLFILSLLFLLSACASSGVTPEGGALEVTCFQAGKADAFLFTTAEGVVLVDCGLKGFGSTILDHLEEKGIEKIDVLILTHFDKDHVGGAAKVINSIEVGTVYQSNYPKDSSEYEKYLTALANAGLTAVTVREATTFTLGGVTFQIDPPDKEAYSSDASNNSSLILSVYDGDISLLFAGDAEEERLEEFLSRNKQRYNLVKLPHHGEEDDQTEALLSSTRPQYAIITSDAENPEDEEVLRLCEKYGAEVYLTRTAPISITTDGETLTVAYHIEGGVSPAEAPPSIL